ncbi:MAG: tetratricopeptide repeat protein [Desulfurivibrio sp.]
MSLPLFAPGHDRGVDPVTGLPDAVALADFLAAPPSDSAGTAEGRPPGSDFLLLLELYPQARDAKRGLAAIQRSGAYLHSLFGASTPLYSLGLGLFALVWSGVAPAEARRMTDTLLRRLRREEFVRAHIGLARLRHNGKNEVGVVDKAWQALAVARKRGPFGLCVAGSERIFPPPGPAERARLSRLWRGRDRFALLDIHQDQPAVSNYFVKRVRSALAPDTPALFLNQREIMVYLDGADEAAARAWLGDFRDRMRESGGVTFSVGIALYPCPGFRKSQLPVNSRKARLHAELLGPDSVAVFNGITLNVSGDAYYNEGDIRKAVAEYRQGLSLDPANVNLLNSLGVALVQLKQPRSALACFEKVLAAEPDNFMAWCNLGFVHLSADRDQAAIACFERALAVNGGPFDLLLQLGKLYCRHRRYTEAAELLQLCVGDPQIEERQEGDLAAALRLLSQALAALDQKRPAMEAAQKALHLNPRDPEALSLLGELYLLNGEGEDIALSLCRQAVELDGERGDYWRRLGWVQWRRGEIVAAEESLARALSLCRRDSLAARWLAEIYRQQGRQRQAERISARANRMR